MVFGEALAVFAESPFLFVLVPVSVILSLSACFVIVVAGIVVIVGLSFGIVRVCPYPECGGGGYM
jgi:hypothetical protein